MALDLSEPPDTEEEEIIPKTKPKGNKESFPKLPSVKKVVLFPEFFQNQMNDE